MPKSRVGIGWFHAETYTHTRASMVDGDNLPRTFVQWRQRALLVEHSMKRSGTKIVRIPIDGPEFGEFCDRHSLIRDVHARMRFVQWSVDRDGRGSPPFRGRDSD